MLTRIRNAINVNKTEVRVPFSKIKESTAKLLKESGFIEGVAVESAGAFKTIALTINQPGTNARITEIKRVSKPGRREYVKAGDIPRVLRGRGIVIMSTSHGVMTGDQAAKKRVGGEVICQVY